MAFGSQTLSSTTANSTNSHHHGPPAQKETIPVQVALRIRPLTHQDRAQPRFSQSTESDVIKVCDNTIIVAPHQKSFTFDHVFDAGSTQEQVFDTVGSNLVDRFIDGYNVTILAYGQTSSGKTYTMGTEISDHNVPDSGQGGIIPRAMSALFQRLQEAQLACHQKAKRPMSANNTTAATSLPSASGLRTPSKRLLSSRSSTRLRPVSMMAPPTSSDSKSNLDSKAPRYSIKVSFVEIYNEDLIDLLNPAPPSERSPVSIREDPKGQIYWTGVKEVAVESTEDVLRHLQLGTLNRATGSTDMNAKSSRSHAIFSVTLRQEKWVPAAETKPSLSTQGAQRLHEGPAPVSSRSSMIGVPLGKRGSTLNVRAMVGQMEKNAQKLPDPVEEDGKWMVSHSKFHFVDLAGSERLKRTAAEGDRRKEGININAGLLALGNVISALADSSKRSAHIPYRDSKLTRLLQDSLGGNATTLMIACISPAEINLTETVNTIKYAHRARHIKNKAERNEAEEWMTNDNTDYLRGIITKLKAEIHTLKTSGSHQPPSPTKPRLQATEYASPSSSLSDTDHHPISTCASSSAKTTITVPDVVDVEQQALVADLRRQIEELHNQVTVTRERNELVEHKLRERRKPVQQPAGADMDFQHLVEPVIEEYEKSISALESQLAMARAALAHSEDVLKEQESKIAEYAATRNAESSVLSDLKAKLAKSLENELGSESYIMELEAKLAKSAQDAMHDQKVLDDLKQKILKFRDMDASTEQYIADLEARLSASEKERDAHAKLVQETQQRINDQEALIKDIQHQLSLSQSDTTQAVLQRDLDNAERRILELDQLLQQQVAKAPVTVDAAVDPIPATEACTSDEAHASAILKDLEEQVASKTLQVQELERQLVDVETMRNELDQLREQQANEIKRLEVYLATTKQEFAQCQDELNMSRQQANELQEASDAALATLNSQIERITSDNEVKAKRIEAANAEIQALTAHISEQEQSMQSMLQLRLEELERANQDINALTLVQNKQAIIIVKLEAKMNAMGHLVKQLQQQLADRERHIELLEAAHREKTAWVQKTQGDVERVFQSVRHVGKEKYQMQQVVQVLEGILFQQERKVDKTTDAVQLLQHQCTLQAADLDKAMRSVEQLTREKEELRIHLQLKSAQASEHETLTATVKQELLEATRCLEEREATISQLKTDIKSTVDQSETVAMEAKLESLEKTLALKEAEQAALHDALSEKQVQLESAQHSLDEQLAKTASLERAIADLKAREIDELDIQAKATSATTEQVLNTSQNQGTPSDEQELRIKLNQVVQELELTRKANLEQQQVIKSLEGSLHAAHNQLDEAVASHTQKSEQIQALQEQLSQRKRLTMDTTLSRDSGLPDEKRKSFIARHIDQEGDPSTLSCSRSSSASSDEMERFSSDQDASLRMQLQSKLHDPQGADELVNSLIQLTAENAQLAVQVNDLESQLVLQRSQLTLETKNLELELMKLMAANERLEKEMEQVMPRSHSRISANLSDRDSVVITSPPQTPRVSSPSSNMSLHYKLQRETSSSSISMLRKSGSYRSVPSVEHGDDARPKRGSVNGYRPSEGAKSISNILRSRAMSASTSPPPPTAPPSNPLPPVPTASASATSPISILDGHAFPTVPERSVSSPVLNRQNSTTSTISDMLNSGGNFTGEQYEKIIRSLQRKIHVADNDVRAHQEVISKLETQLSRSENTVREVKRQLETLMREKDTYVLEIQSLRKQVSQVESGQQTAAEQEDEKRRMLEQDLENERRLKEKAERARRILENRMEELMNKRNKFMCF